MKGRFLLLGCLLTSSSVYAVTPSPSTASNVSHAEAQVESKQIAAAAAPSAPSPPPGTVGAGTGYFEVVGGFGIAQTTVGKSLLGISTSERDWVSQTNKQWQSPFANLGVGYIYALSDVKRGYADKFVWLPSVEAMLNLYYSNINAKGNVYRFNNGSLNTQTFTLPIKSTSLMLDAILTLASVKQFSLFVLGGMGETWSQIKYHDVPNGNPNARASLRLNSRSQSNGTYQWGTGLTFAFNPRIALSVEYLYTHIGNIKTSSRGTLGGVTDTQLKAATFGLRSQAVFADLRLALS
jgi:opacity protein-like surface antigen